MRSPNDNPSTTTEEQVKEIDSMIKRLEEQLLKLEEKIDNSTTNRDCFLFEEFQSIAANISSLKNKKTILIEWKKIPEWEEQAMNKLLATTQTKTTNSLNRKYKHQMKLNQKTYEYYFERKSEDLVTLRFRLANTERPVVFEFNISYEKINNFITISAITETKPKKIFIDRHWNYIPHFNYFSFHFNHFKIHSILMRIFEWFLQDEEKISAASNVSK